MIINFIIFASIIAIPTVQIGGFVISSIECVLIGGVFLASNHIRARLYSAVMRDHFACSLLLFTIASIVVMGANIIEIRDFNHTRFYSAFPALSYCFFYAISLNKKSRGSLLNVMAYALLMGLMLNILVLYRPDLPIWAYYAAGKEDVSGEQFGVNSLGRVAGLFGGDSIFTASFCAICIVTGLALLSLSLARHRSITAVALIVLGGGLLVSTQSRMPCLLVILIFGCGACLCFPIIRSLGMSGSRILLLSIFPLLLYFLLVMFRARGSVFDEATRVDSWKSSVKIIFDTDRNFLIGTGTHRLIDTVGLWHSHNVWLFCALVYGVPMALLSVLIYYKKLREVWLEFDRRRDLINKRRIIPNDDDVIVYSTILVFSFFIMESLFEVTFFQIPRVSVFLYALLGMSKAASEDRRAGSIIVSVCCG